MVTKTILSILILSSLNLKANEEKSLIKDILENPETIKWSETDDLSSKLIGSFLLHTHPIAPFTMKRLAKNKHLEIPSNDLDFSIIAPHAVRLQLSLKFFDDTGKKSVISLHPNSAVIIDIATAKRLTHFFGHTQYVNCGTFSKDGSKVVTASNDTTAKIWNAVSGDCILTLSGHTAEVVDAVLIVREH